MREWVAPVDSRPPVIVAVDEIPDPLNVSRNVISEFFTVCLDQVPILLRQWLVGVHEFDRPFEVGAKAPWLKRLTYNRLKVRTV